MTDANIPIPIPDSDEGLLAECRVETFRAGGPGGQHQNATESGVRLVHLPTGLRASAREERSQHRNRSTALKRLRAKLEERNFVPKARRRTKPTHASRRKRLDNKRKRGERKKLRRRPDRGD